MARHNAVNWPSRSGGIASFRSHAEIRLRFVGAFCPWRVAHAKRATNRRVKYAETLRYSMMAGVCPRAPTGRGGPFEEGCRRGIQSNPGRTIKDPAARRRRIS
jgi:hypothetical protein